MALHTHPYIKKIAASAYPSRDKEQKHLKFQAGLTLIELMIGLAVGLLVVAVATVSLLGSRSVTGAVSDISGIQQQAAYVMRTFGTQLRQAGSLYLDLGLDAGDESDIITPTVFQLLGNSEQAIHEAEGTGAITIQYTGYEEPTFADNGPISRNCLAEPGKGVLGPGETIPLESIFTISGTDLYCNGQPIAQNVAAFQVRYLLQGTDQDDPTMLYTNRAGVADWNRVQGVEVCLVLFGTERIDLPEGASYTGCDGSTAVNITTLAAPRTNRMHYVFRNVFQLRSQGLI